MTIRCGLRIFIISSKTSPDKNNASVGGSAVQQIWMASEKALDLCRQVYNGIQSASVKCQLSENNLLLLMYLQLIILMCHKSCYSQAFIFELKKLWRWL
jgi:hypothetical protein